MAQATTAKEWKYVPGSTYSINAPSTLTELEKLWDELKQRVLVDGFTGMKAIEIHASAGIIREAILTGKEHRRLK